MLEKEARERNYNVLIINNEKESRKRSYPSENVLFINGTRNHR